MAATLSDVAKRAGVSKKTASRVINNEDTVAAATRRKVLAAIEELGYVPNEWAQRLASGNSRIVGYLIGDYLSPYSAHVLNGLLDVADAAGHHVSILRIDIDDPQQIERVITMARLRRMEGIVLAPPCHSSPRLMGALQEMAFPFVQHSPSDRCSGCAWVSAADEQGSYDAAWHLLRLGHRRIGFIQGPVDLYVSRARLAGYKRALKEADIAVDESLIKPGDWGFESGLEYARELLSLPEPPTAIMANNDVPAAGAIQAAWERGVNCPGQLSVVGFDDVPLAKQIAPPLTTVRQPIYDIGATMMSILIEEIIPGIKSNHAIEVPTELVIRHSTGAVRNQQDA
ncbi:MAG: LacI family transcriptional regulator [Chloroflexi bacterium]|nr:LacI family transcriptional regulator [Chloroflexota bacterium]